MLTLTTTARKLKITAVIDAAPFVKLGVPPDDAPPRTTLTVAVGGRTITADLATKSVRKAMKTLLEHGTENVVLVLQGELNAQNQVESAGVVAQVKAQTNAA
jgi:hypothetical protein